MARVHTNLPEGKGHQGERRLAERLVELTGDDSHLWFGLDYLPNVADIDLLLVRPDLACFNIEVKAVTLEMIEEFGLNVCQIRGRGSAHHPVAQAARAQIGLRTYLNSVGKDRCPFFIATAAFPVIRRSEMLTRFPGAGLQLQLEGVLFQDDLESSTKLATRLQSIRAQPPRGSGARDPRPTAAQVDSLIAALDPGSIPDIGQPDKERGELLRRQVGGPGQSPRPAAAAGRYLMPAFRAPVIFVGAPGTGKTVNLQEVGVAHARAGRNVLFTCFNKVLASSMRAAFASQDLGPEVSQRLLVVHVDELRQQLEGEEIAAFKSLFGTVLVDEAQDMSQRDFDFLAQLAEAEAEWFLADGPGQELYNNREPSAFLVGARARGIVEKLRRNYRNKSAGFLVAQAMYEFGPDISKIDEWVAKKPLAPASADGEPTLDLGTGLEISTGGDLPRVVQVSLPAGRGWKEAKLGAYVAVFAGELEQLAAAGKPRDLAVLFARASDSKTPEPERARAALAMLGVPVHDQLDPDNRGTPVPDGHVRLSSIHSSRGVEASRIVVLDLDHGLSWAPDHVDNSRVMVHIAMSRAQIQTTVVTFGTDNPFVAFLIRLLDAYKAS